MNKEEREHASFVAADSLEAVHLARRWKYKFNVKEAWEKVSEKKISIQEFASTLQSLMVEASKKHEIEDIECQISNLQGVIDDPNIDEDGFDEVMEEIYDWADQNRVWIATMF